MNCRIKKAFICAGVQQFQIDENLSANYLPSVGDVAIFEVLNIGKHTKIQADDRRHITLMPGDHLMAAFGNRYATGQFEGYIPEAPQQEYHILGGGGTVGILHSMHTKFDLVGPTTLRMIGFAIQADGSVINTIKLNEHLRYEFSGVGASLTKVILSLGSSMDSGKTTTAAHLGHGLKKLGKKVAYIKLTGTVYSKDADLNFDLGADMAIDFSLLGYPSTFLCEEEELLCLYVSLFQQVLACEPDYTIIEIADGLLQRETKMLLNNKMFIDSVDKVVYSSSESMGALQGVQILNRWGIIPFALSGLFTASPLLIQEVKDHTNIPVFTLDDLISSPVNYFTYNHVLKKPA
jgi:hypothetical protein